MKRILIVDDDNDLLLLLVDALRAKHKVDAAATLSQAYDLIEGRTYDLVIADRLLPDGDSLELIHYLADSAYQTKVIVISRLYECQEKIKTLEGGSDDFLVKPFSLSELKIKVEKFLLFDKKRNQHTIATHAFTFYPDTGCIKSGDKTIDLRKKEAQILLCLLRYKNRVVSRETIIDEVWSLSEMVPTQTTLDVYIRRIRILLGEFGTHIVTKRGFGYMFADS